MSEHDSHEDSAISALYRRMSHEEPSPQLDERVMDTARRHAARHSHRWWLPLSTAAVVVLAVSVVVLRQQQPPVELQGVAKYEERPAASEPLPAAVPAESPAPAAPPKEMRALEKPQQEAKSQVAEATPSAEAKRGAEPPAAPVAASAPELAAKTEKDKAELNLADVARRATAPAVPTAEAERSAETQAESSGAGVLTAKSMNILAEKKQADVAASAPAPSARAGAQPQQKFEAAKEAPEVWLKRIDALRAKNDMEGAKRELAAFRKAYPNWPLPKELQALLPETTK